MFSHLFFIKGGACGSRDKPHLAAGKFCMRLPFCHDILNFFNKKYFAPVINSYQSNTYNYY